MYAFHIIKDHDELGDSAHGPYTMAEAESRLQPDEKIITRKSLAALRGSSFPTVEEDGPLPGSSPKHQKMLSEIRSWGIILLILGAIQVFASGFLNSTWGLLLIIVGAASFYFRSPAMFVIYGTTLAWAAVSNALGGSSGWVKFSILQAYFTFRTFKQFFHFRHAAIVQPVVDPAAKPFPFASFILGLLSIVGLVTVFLGAVLATSISGAIQVPAYLDLAEGVVVDFAVIAVAAGLASMLCRFKYKLFSILGIITGGLVLFTEIAFYLI